MRWPEFIIAGSPKCGTTAAQAYLRQQEGVFVPLEKEPNFFSTDIRLRKRKTREQYLDLFEPAPPESLAGEVSVWYLYSRVAAAAIREACGPIRIVAMVRNPIEAIASLHAQLLYEGDEPERDLERALAEARSGPRVPASRWKGSECLDYLSVYTYAPQIERFFEAFGRERVYVITFDDWKADTAAAYGGLCRFLGVEPTAEIDFKTVNPNKRVRRPKLRDWSRSHNRTLRNVGRALLPGDWLRLRVRRPLARLLKRSYTQVEPRERMPEHLRSELSRTVRPDVERLSELLGRDLSGWLEEPVA